MGEPGGLPAMGSHRVGHDRSDLAQQQQQQHKTLGFQVVLMVKSLPANAGDVRDVGSIPGLERSPGRGPSTHSVFLPGESQGQRNLAGYSPQGCKESDISERLSKAQSTI